MQDPLQLKGDFNETCVIDVHQAILTDHLRGFNSVVPHARIGLFLYLGDYFRVYLFPPF